MEAEKVSVKMLGDFTVSYRGQEISLGRGITSRTAQLFQMLMLDPEHKISRERILVNLYGDGEYSDKTNCINSLLHRLREKLTKAGLPGGDCVQVNSGSYIWNRDIPLEVDALRFRRLMEEGEEAEKTEKYSLLHEAWYLYRGDLLFSNSMEGWIIPEMIYYKQLYQRCTRELARILKEEHKYEQLLDLYKGASALDPSGEWHAGQLDTLVETGNQEEAFAMYQSMAEARTEEGPWSVSGEMLQRFRTMGSHIKSSYEDIEQIKKKLNESSEEEAGAYECAYPYFVDVYRLMKRMGRRWDISSYLMQCSLVNRKKMPMQGRSGDEKGELLAQSIKNALRKGDVFTQYCPGNYLIILNQVDKSLDHPGGGERKLPESICPDPGDLREQGRKTPGCGMSDHSDFQQKIIMKTAIC